MARRRGRPPGTSGRAAVPIQVADRHIFRTANPVAGTWRAPRPCWRCPSAWVCAPRSWPASGGPTLRPGGAYPESHAPQGGAYTKGGRTRDVFVSSPALRRVLEKYGERHGVLSARASQAALFPSQKGGPMTACSMARFLKALYRETGIAGRPRTAGCGR